MTALSDVQHSEGMTCADYDDDDDDDVLSVSLLFRPPAPAFTEISGLIGIDDGRQASTRVPGGRGKQEACPVRVLPCRRR